MEDADDTLTVEEAAALLKVNTATIERELRSKRLTGNTVGSVLRIRRGELHEYLKGPPPVQVTEGEWAFEKYLNSVSLPFAFEEPVPGTTKRPDYRLTLESEPARFEVKQLDPQPDDFRTGIRMEDPYPALRERINAHLGGIFFMCVPARVVRSVAAGGLLASASVRMAISPSRSRSCPQNTRPLGR